jgi:4'-phosphopantetheinyl transferase EntD
MARRGANPGERRGGRKKGTPNKSTADIKALAQKHGPEMIEGLVNLARTAESEAARIAAMNSVLDRGYGKPVAPFSGPDGEPLFPPKIEIEFVG